MSVDYGALRGTNYVVSTTLARDHFQAMLSPLSTVAPSVRARYPGPSGCFVPFGQFDQCTVFLELERLYETGCRNIRTYTPFTAWLIDPGEFLRNLRFICDTCACFGMSVTCIVWTSSTAGEGFADGWLATDTAMRRRAVEPSAIVRDFSDQWHSYYIDRSGSLLLPPITASPGTYFLMAPWSDPDNHLRYAGHITALSRTGLEKWNGRFPRLDAFAVRPQIQSRARQQVGGLGDAINVFLREIASVFKSHPAFLSYDLFNEPLLGDIVHNNEQLDSIANIIAATYSVLADEHSASRPLQFPDATIGMGSIPVIPPILRQRRVDSVLDLYQRVNRLLARLYPQSPPKLAYSSFHILFEDDLLHQRTYSGIVDQMRNVLGVDCVISEFFAQLSPLSRRLRGNLAGMLNLMTRNRVGGQIWSILETNFLNPVWANGAPTGMATPSEGFFRPLDPTRVTPDCFRLQPPGVRFDFVNYQGRSRDLAALRAWFGVHRQVPCMPRPVTCR